MLVQSVSLFSNSKKYKKNNLNNNISFGALKPGEEAAAAAKAAAAKVTGTVHEITAADFRRAFPDSKVPDPKDCQPSKPYHIQRAEEDIGSS